MRSFGRAALIAAAVLAAACGGGDEPAIESEEKVPGAAAPTAAAATPAAGAVTGSLTASDQTSDGTTLKVASVTIKGKKGFIAIHQDVNGAPGPVVGHSALLPEGTSASVVVKLDQKVATGAFWPMLHEDSNGDGKYTFPEGGTDPPVIEARNPVMKKIQLTVG